MQFFRMSCILMMGFLLGVSGAMASTLQMTQPADEILVQGATPGGKVVLMGVAYQSDGFSSTVDTVAYQLEDLELDGAVAFSLANPANFDLDESKVQRSVWIAVDLTSGDYIVYAPHAGEVIESPGDFITARVSGQWQVGFGAQEVEAMLVRPGTDAWAGSFEDGGPSDLGANSDGAVSFTNTSLTSVPVYGNGFSGVSTLNRFVRGDIFFFIDHRTLEYKVVSVGGSK